MRKSDLLGVFALLTGGLFALPGEGAVAAVPLAAAGIYAAVRSGRRPSRRDLLARLAPRSR